MLGRKSLLVIVATGLSFLLGFISILFITHILGPEPYGAFATVMAFVVLFSPLADLGINSAHIKRVSEGADIAECVSTYAVCKIVLTSLMVALTFGGWIVLTSTTPSVNTPLAWNMLFLLLGQAVFTQLALIVTMTYNGKSEFARSQIISLIDPLVRVPLVIIFCLGGYGIEEVTFAYFFGTLVMILIAFATFFHYGFHWKKPTKFGSYFSFALPLVIPTIFAAITGSVDKLTIGAFWGPAPVGYYSAAMTLVSFFTIIGIAIYNTTYPTLSRMHLGRKFDEIKQMTSDINRYIIILLMPVTILLFIYPAAIITIIFGLSFLGAENALRFLSLYILVWSLSQIYAVRILAANRPGVFVKTGFIFLAVMLTLLLVLVPDHVGPFQMAGLSSTGAAIAVLGGYTANYFCLRIVIKKMNGVTHHKVGRMLAGTGSTSIILIGMGMIVPMNTMIVLVLYGLISVASFWGSLILLKEITKDDIRFVWDVVNMKKMGSYISGEMKGKNGS